MLSWLTKSRPNGTVYRGLMKNNKRHGMGSERFPTGKIRTGY